MLILLDNSVPRGLARALAGHTVTEARERGWATMTNGDLLSVAEEAGFEVLVTSDKNMRHQQNSKDRKIAVVALSQGRWALVRHRLAEIAAVAGAAAPGSYAEFAIPFD